MSEQYTHETFLSPFTWRYGTDAMRSVWSLAHTRRLWRRIWVALAAAQQRAGLVSEAQVEDLRRQQDAVDLGQAHALERELKHDLMAEVHVYASQCPIGGSIIHLGATSMDIEDNADALKLREALALIRQQLSAVMVVLAERIEQEAERVCMAFTHIQPAEPTTLGYRLAFYAQDLLMDYEAVTQVWRDIKGKGLKGAVGTAASYAELLRDKGVSAQTLERWVMDALELPYYTIAHQTYTRKQDWHILNALAGVAMTASKFAFDLRLLQSPPLGEWHEPFGDKQIGSSAMPFKRNPINAENINSLARYVASLPHVAWDNAAHSLLERTLDDSANRRVILAEAFLAVDEILLRLLRLLKGMRFDSEGIARNLAVYGVFAGSERVMMEAARRGGDRQALHEAIRQHSLTAWARVQAGEPNPLVALLASDALICKYLRPEELPELLAAEQHIGDAPQRARQMAYMLRQAVQAANGIG